MICGYRHKKIRVLRYCFLLYIPEDFLCGKVWHVEDHRVEDNPTLQGIFHGDIGIGVPVLFRLSYIVFGKVFPACQINGAKDPAVGYDNVSRVIPRSRLHPPYTAVFNTNADNRLAEMHFSAKPLETPEKRFGDLTAAPHRVAKAGLIEHAGRAPDKLPGGRFLVGEGEKELGEAVNEEMNHLIIGETGNVVLQAYLIVNLHVVSFQKRTKQAKGTDVALCPDPQVSGKVHLMHQRFNIKGEVEFDPSHHPAGGVPCDPFQITAQSPVDFAVRTAVSPAEHVYPEIVMKPLLLHGGAAPARKGVRLQQSHLTSRLCQK